MDLFKPLPNTDLIQTHFPAPLLSYMHQTKVQVKATGHAARNLSCFRSAKVNIGTTETNLPAVAFLILIFGP